MRGSVRRKNGSHRAQRKRTCKPQHCCSIRACPEHARCQHGSHSIRSTSSLVAPLSLHRRLLSPATASGRLCQRKSMVSPHFFCRHFDFGNLEGGEGGEHSRRAAGLLFLCFMAEGFLRLCRLRALIHPRTRAPTQRPIHTEAGVHHVVLPASQRVAMPRDRDRTEPAALRAKIRTNDFTGQTSGHAAGFVQANFCALPKVRRGILLVVLRAGRCRQPVCPREKT